MYNRKFNCFVRPKYDGSHQTFPDLNLKGLASRGIKSVYPVAEGLRLDALKQNGGGICDHEVGTGKTLIMCIAAHEMKRLNLAHKPMIIGLKANVAEIAATYQAAYPNARILYASEKDFSTANRVVSSTTSRTTTMIASSCRTTSSGRYRSRRNCSSASCRLSLIPWRKTSK